MSDNKKSYYAIIPASVRYDKNLKANAKLLYGEITALCNEKGYCWANNNYFASLYEVKKETASRWISNLEQGGYITVELIYKKDSKEIAERRIHLGNDKKINTPCQKSHGGNDRKVMGGNDYLINTPIDEKVKDNSTSFNNTNTNTTSNNTESGNSGSGGDFKTLLQLFERNGFGLLNMTTKETLVELEETYSIEWVIDAFEIAVEANVRKISYVRGILKKWHAEGKSEQGETKSLKSRVEGMDVTEEKKRAMAEIRAKRQGGI